SVGEMVAEAFAEKLAAGLADVNAPEFVMEDVNPVLVPDVNVNNSSSPFAGAQELALVARALLAPVHYVGVPELSVGADEHVGALSLSSLGWRWARRWSCSKAPEATFRKCQVWVWTERPASRRGICRARDGAV